MCHIETLVSLSDISYDYIVCCQVNNMIQSSTQLSEPFVDTKKIISSILEMDINVKSQLLFDAKSDSNNYYLSIYTLMYKLN